VNPVHWAPDPVMFVVGQREFTWYALLFVGGLLGGYVIVARTFMAEGIDIVYANLILIFVALGAVIGARLGEIVFYEWSYYRAHPREILKIWHGGLASHGAAIGIGLMLWLFARFVVRKPFLWVADHAVIAIAFVAACVRFGNLINSEVLGKPTSVPWAVVFDRVDRVPRHPVQVYEGLWYIALSLALFLARRRWKPPQGVLSGLFLVGMFLPRFLLEFAKQGTVVFAGMNTGQVLSVPLIIAGALVLGRFGWRTKERAR
jgi:phosphatidylglycerol:prolipoprotein diacylglycerol transferase